MGKLHLVLASTFLSVATLCRALPPLSSTEKRQLEREARLVVDYMQNGHESGRLFRDIDNRDILASYLDSLDPDGEILLKDDADFVFTRFGRSFRSVYLLKGDLHPAFEIFDLFAKRAEERARWAEQRLARGFDFTVDETLPPPADEPAASVDEANRRWETKLKAHVLAEILQGATEQEAIATVAKRYAKYRRQIASMDTLAIRERFFDGLLQSFDPHSGYFSADSTKEFHLEMSGAVAGAGLELKKENGLCVVADIKPGGPADLTTDLRPGDIVESYAEPGAIATPVKGRRLREIVAGIRGKAGTKVALTYRHPGDAEPRTATIERANVVSLEDRARGILWQVPDASGKIRHIGLIDLPGFYANEDETGKSSATADVLELLNQMRATGLDGLVVDLRENGGGALTEARALTGLFVPKGHVILSRGLDGKVEEHTLIESNARYDGPLVVLTSERSASASEIFAGAMKFHRRGLVVGSPATFGKGSVQAYIELAKTRSATPADAATWGTLRLTHERYFRPDGGAVQCDGIAADIVLPQKHSPDFRREKDLPHALPAAKVPAPATALPCPDVKHPVTPALVARLDSATQDNIAKLPEWSLWQREEKLLRELAETDGQSLLLEKRRTDYDDAEHKLAALRTERRQLSATLDYAARNIELPAVQQALDAHRARLLQPDTSGQPIPLHQLRDGGFLFKTDLGKPRRIWLDQLDYRRFLGDAELLATAFSATGTTLPPERMRSTLQSIARLEKVDEPAVLAAFAGACPAGTEPAAIRQGVGAVLLRMTEIEGDLRRHHRALDIQLREALRVAAAWSAESPTPTPAAAQP